MTGVLSAQIENVIPQNEKSIQETKEDKLDSMFENPTALKYGAVIVIDADDLKKANDTYGHENGDCYLRALADILTSLQAPEQLTARIGGDEFVVYFGEL